MQKKNTNVKTFDVTLEQFFRVWLLLLKPFHKMTNKEMDIVAYLLYRRHNLMLKVKDEKLVNQLLIDTEVREEIKKKMGYSNNQVLSNMLSELRNRKILIGDSVTRVLIPNVEDGADVFQLVFNLNIKNEA
jgi:hypothetical protein